MSYDVAVGGHSYNYTSNMRQFFIDFEVDIPTFNGQQAWVVARRIDAALQTILRRSLSDLRSYEPDNNWGQWDSAMIFLMTIRDEALRGDPTGLVTVTW